MNKISCCLSLNQRDQIVVYFVCGAILNKLLSILLDPRIQFLVLFQLNQDFIKSLVIFNQLRYLKRLISVQSILLLNEPWSLKNYWFRKHLSLLYISIFQLKNSLLRWWSQQVNRFHFDCQPHIICHFQVLFL